MQAVISGLLMIVKGQTCGQNTSDLDRLTQRLYRLSCHISNAPTAQDYPEQCRRDSLVRILQETSTQLTNLRKRSLAYRSVTQAIAGCSSEINNYLLESLWSSQMQSHNQVSAIQRQQEQVLMKIESLIIRDQSSVGPTATQLTATVAGCVTLVDATGYGHPISVNFCTSYQSASNQLNEMLQVLFKRDTAEARIQRRYFEKGRYDLSIDEGTRVARLTSDQWSTIEAGMTIVMRVVFEQQDISSSEVDYKCHFCGAINHLPTESISYSQAGCSIDCRACKRRFYISRRWPSRMQSTQSSKINFTTFVSSCIGCAVHEVPDCDQSEDCTQYEEQDGAEEHPDYALGAEDGEDEED
ncbi:hypothetical protein DFH29DRAFT_1083319 [Suillus ampliporus]|nr:hypothetical protein DFH29DRAFT_1083319 [Suillus ampliporus]